MRFQPAVSGSGVRGPGYFCEGCVRARRDYRSAGRRQSSGGAECGGGWRRHHARAGCNLHRQLRPAQQRGDGRLHHHPIGGVRRPAAAGGRPGHPGVRGSIPENPLVEQHLRAANVEARRTTGSSSHSSSSRTRAGTETSSRSAPRDSTQTQLAQVPYAFVLDRLYVHGDPVLGQKRGIALHSSDTTLINSYVSDCKAIGQDSQALSGYNGPGNYLIENNYLEGAAENVLFGGADPRIPNLVTANITFRRNYLSKPLALARPYRGHSGGRHRDACARWRIASSRDVLLQGGGAPDSRPGRQGLVFGIRRGVGHPSTRVRPAA